MNELVLEKINIIDGFINNFLFIFLYKLNRKQ